MSRFLRSAAPALLVGTAAVVVVGAADNGLATVVGAADPGMVGSAEPPPASSGLAPWEQLQRFLDDDDHDDDHDDDYDDDDDHDDDHDDDYGDDGYAVAPLVGGAPGQASGGGTASGSTGSAAGECTAAEVTGPTVRTEWGPVQVAAQVSNGRVCGIRTIIYPDGDRKSVTINARAVPAIEQQVLAAGDASFQGVSGATVTTEGYRTSLQAILDGS